MGDEIREYVRKSTEAQGMRGAQGLPLKIEAVTNLGAVDSGILAAVAGMLLASRSSRSGQPSPEVKPAAEHQGQLPLEGGPGPRGDHEPIGLGKLMDGYSSAMTESAVEVLERDHEGICELFERVHSPDEDRPGVLRVLVERLAAHVAIEQSLILHELRKSDASDSALEKELKADYHVIEHNLVLIERRKANSPDMPDLVTEMHDAFRGHIERCQKRLYPDLERCLSDAQLIALGEQLQSADNVVLTHAHPHLLSLGPLSRLTTRIAGNLDKARGAGEWGGLATTDNDNSQANHETPDPVEGKVAPPPWRDPKDG